MAKIIIGREYASEFESICALYAGGFLSSDVHIIKAQGKVIQTPSHTFEYREREHGVNGSGEGEERTLNFSADGASWFAPLRGEKFDSGNADWKQLVMDVAADYHRHYSLIEFRQAKDKGTLNEERRLKERFKTGFIDRVFNEGARYVMAENRIIEPENYYAVSLRLEINGGGESAPLLGKIYFREGEDGRLTPITFAEAGRIDEYISGSVPDEDGRGGEGIVDVKLVGRVFAGLENSFGSGKFSKYVSFGGKYKKEIENLGNGKGRCIACEHAVFLNDAHQLLKGVLLDLHVLGSNLHYQIAVRADVLQAAGHLRHDGVSLLLLHFPFSHKEV